MANLIWDVLVIQLLLLLLLRGVAIPFQLLGLPRFGMGLYHMTVSWHEEESGLCSDRIQFRLISYLHYCLSLTKNYSGGPVDVRPAIYAELLLKLTVTVSFFSDSGGYRSHMVTFRRFEQILLDLLWRQRPPRKPPWNYWDEMESEIAMGMITHMQEGEREMHITSSRSFFLFQPESDVHTTTSKSRQKLKVMLKAFWSFSYMLLAINIKYMKGGLIRHSLIARKAYVKKAGLTHSIIEATASHICEKRLYPSSLYLLYVRICFLLCLFFAIALLISIIVIVSCTANLVTPSF